MGRGNLSDLRKITAFMRKNGILCFRNAQFEIRLSRQALKIPIPKSKADIPHVDSDPQARPPTQDELLFWSSTPGIGTDNAENRAL